MVADAESEWATRPNFHRTLMTAHRRFFPRRSQTEPDLGNCNRLQNTLPVLLPASSAEKTAYGTGTNTACISTSSTPAFLLDKAAPEKPPGPQGLNSFAVETHRRHNSCHSRSAWPKAERTPVVKSTVSAPQPVVKGTSARDSNGSRLIRRATTFTAQTTPASCQPGSVNEEDNVSQGRRVASRPSHSSNNAQATRGGTASTYFPPTSAGLNEAKSAAVAATTVTEDDEAATIQASTRAPVCMKRGSPLIPTRPVLHQEHNLDVPRRQTLAPMSNPEEGLLPPRLCRSAFAAGSASPPSKCDTQSCLQSSDRGRVLRGHGKTAYRDAMNHIAAEYRQSFRQRPSAACVDHSQSNYEYAALHGNIKV